MSKSVLQDWVCELTLQQQTALITAVRGPDGLPKDHISKKVLTFLRRCVLREAFTGKTIDDPYTAGGGSFMKPWPANTPAFTVFAEYLSATDEVPLHFHMHLVHAAEIIGYKHPSSIISAVWRRFYELAINDLHLEPESPLQMDFRLSDRRA